MTKTDQDETDHKATETDQDKSRWIKLLKKKLIMIMPILALA